MRTTRSIIISEPGGKPVARPRRITPKIDYLNILKARTRLALQYREFSAGLVAPPQSAASNDAPPEDRIARG